MVAVRPLFIQQYGTLTDEWAQKPFFAEPDTFDRAANCTCTTNIELAVTQPPNDGQTTSSASIGKAHSQSVRSLYEKTWKSYAKYPVSVCLVLSFLANLEVSFSSNILLSCQYWPKKEDIVIFIVLHLTQSLHFDIEEGGLHHNFPRKRDGILKERERRVAKQRLARLRERKSN